MTCHQIVASVNFLTIPALTRAVNICVDAPLDSAATCKAVVMKPHCCPYVLSNGGRLRLLAGAGVAAAALPDLAHQLSPVVEPEAERQAAENGRAAQGLPVPVQPVPVCRLPLHLSRHADPLQSRWRM